MCNCFCCTSVKVAVVSDAVQSFSHFTLVGELKSVASSSKLGTRTSFQRTKELCSSMNHGGLIEGELCSDDGGLSTYEFVFNKESMTTTNLVEGGKFILLVTALAAVDGTEELSSVGSLESTPFTILSSVPTVESIPIEATDTITDLLESYTAICDANRQAELDRVRRELSSAEARTKLSRVLQSYTPSNPPSAPPPLRLDLVTGDIVEQAMAQADLAVAHRRWYSPLCSIAPDPTASLMQNMFSPQTAVDRALACIERHNQIMEDTEPLPEIDETVPGMNAERTPVTSPGCNPSAPEGQTSDPAAAASALPTATPSALSETLSHTTDATVQLARRITRRRTNDVSPEFALFFGVLPDVKRIYRDLARPFLSPEFPHLPALKRARSYLRNAGAWSWPATAGAGEAGTTADGPGTDGKADTEAGQGRTNRDTTAVEDSASSELDTKGRVRPSVEPNVGAGQDHGRAEQVDQRPLTRPRRERPVPLPIPISNRQPTLPADDKHSLRLELFMASAAGREDTGLPALDLLALLADRIISGEHLRAEKARHRARRLRSRLAAQARRAMETERAAVALAASLSAEREKATAARPAEPLVTDRSEGKDDPIGFGKPAKKRQRGEASENGAAAATTTAVPNEATRADEKRLNNKERKPKNKSDNPSTATKRPSTTARPGRQQNARSSTAFTHNLVRFGAILHREEEGSGSSSLGEGSSSDAGEESDSDRSLMSVSVDEDTAF